MTENELVEMANECGLILTPQIEAFAKLVASKERVELRKGYAGVTLWIDDAQVTQLVTETEIKYERVKGNALANAAQKCLDIYAGARG